MRLKTSNPELLDTIKLLRKKSNETGAAVWGDLAKKLDRVKQKRTIANLSHIKRCFTNGDTIAIPGKVLGAGTIDHSVQIAAFSFSSKAREKILKVGGECLTFLELVEKNPKGTNVKILG